jgi:hypothetical protein
MANLFDLGLIRVQLARGALYGAQKVTQDQ